MKAEFKTVQGEFIIELTPENQFEEVAIETLSHVPKLRAQANYDTTGKKKVNHIIRLKKSLL